jgi:hypothetical protein
VRGAHGGSAGRKNAALVRFGSSQYHPNGAAGGDAQYRRTCPASAVLQS